MGFSPAGAQPVSLSVFGSWVTEMSPDALPEGVSPDNQDQVFVPGSAGSRPALQKVFATPFPSGGPGNLRPTGVYGKSFVTPTGVIKNLTMDSNGSLWVEDLTNNPGVNTLLFQSVPGSFCRSITAEGREWFAISDGLHGADVPLQWDGANLDRVTQDGPAVPPVVTSIALPPATLTGPPTPPQVIAVATVTPISPFGPVPDYTQFQIQLSGLPSPPLALGQIVTVAGNSLYNPTAVPIVNILNPELFIVPGFQPAPISVGAGGNATIGSGSTLTLQRLNNTVSGQTTAPHNLRVGYQGLIAGMDAAAVGGGIASIVIDNEANPGIATVTTNNPHGLLPQNQASILGVTGAAVGGGISNIAFAGDLITITTAAPHGLQVGSEVLVALGTTVSANGQWVVQTVPTPTTFTYAFVSSVAAFTAADTGTVTYIWPLVTEGVAPNYFTVNTAPTPTTFTMSINYSDGTWTGGTITFGWDGTFYIASVPSPESFTYLQYGPNASSTVAGTITPYGQCAPGLHLCRMSYLTRQGQQTRPSPYTQFEAAGGQYVSVSQMSIGPANIVARILEFTGAQGSFFFYIPTPAQVNGQVVSTATQINDNVTTSAVLDFGDPTLYTAIGTSTPTYSTAQQTVLDGALGFLFWKQRLETFGQRNTVNNFLNMGFDADTTGVATPQGWALVGANGGGITVNGRLNTAWQVTVGATLQPYGYIEQSAYEDCYGAPILEGNQTYTVRFWASMNGAFTTDPIVYVKLDSALVAFHAVELISIGAAGYYQATFTIPTTDAIPTDLVFNFYVLAASAAAGTVTLDEFQIINAASPYTDNLCNGAYLNAPEQFNGVSGQFGPPDDTHKIMDGAVIRNTLYLLTQDPEGRLHQVTAGNTEPAGWDVDEVDSACGALSAFTMTKSQADNRSASGGEEWFAWASQSGARIFGGSTAHKIGQEIQSAWFDQVNNQAWPQINMAAALTAWALNDPSTRTIYFGLPLLPVGGSGGATAPNIIYPVNYRELDSAEAIAGSPPFHPSFAGRLIATDNTRKWTRWNMTINGGALMFRSPGVLSMVLFGGNGQAYGAAAGFGNIYTLNPAKFTDDDFGQIFPYYVTAALPSIDQEQGLQLGAGRKQLAYFSAMIGAVANVTISILCNNLQNPWALTCTRTPGTNPNYDLEWGGGSAQAQRMFFKIASSPIGAGTDNSFQLRKLSAWFRVARLAIRGKA